MLLRKHFSSQSALDALDEYFADLETELVCSLHGLRPLPSTDSLQKLYKTFVHQGVPHHLYRVVDEHWAVLAALQKVHHASTASERVQLRAELQRRRAAHHAAVEVARAAVAPPTAVHTAGDLDRPAKGNTRLAAAARRLLRWRAWGARAG